MKFDVVIGNPPYQKNDGSTSKNNALSTALYHLFVDKAKELNPSYISMIIPSRWMTRSARGVPDVWIDEMINDKRIKEMHDFINSEDVFDGVMIRGGVNYFLWDNEHDGKCHFYQHSKDNVINDNIYLNTKDSDIVIRDMKSITIIDKIVSIEGEYLSDSNDNFSSMVSPKNYFTDIKNRILTSNWNGFVEEKDDKHNVIYYVSRNMSSNNIGWIKRSDVPRNHSSIRLNKVFINAAGHGEKFGPVLGKPFYGIPNSACSQTYLVIGYDEKRHNFSKEECLNIISYIQTKFFRFMVDVKKGTQNVSRDAYQFVPLQDFTKPWTDAELYAKYKLTEEEIAYIEDNIEPMGDQDDLVDLEVDLEEEEFED